MKKLFIATILLLFAGTVYADTVVVVGQAVAGAAPGPTYLVNQNFEGTGYDNSETWTESATPPDEDYTTVALRGSQSLGCVGNYSNAYVSFSAISGQADIFFRFHATAMPATNSSFLYIRDTSGNVLASARLYSTGDIRAYHGSVYGNAGASTIAEDTTYYIWVEYTAGTGDNGTLDLFVSATTTKPGTAEISITTGTSTADAGRVMLAKDSGDTDATFVFDQVLVDDAGIGNVDS